MNAENKESESFKNRFQELIQACQVELKKTTQIGMKMLSASQSNSLLNEYYENLGRMAAKAVKNNEIDWKNEKVQDLVAQIEALKSELSNLENDVQTIKKED